MSEFIYTKENPLRVFTSFSGYDSQCMALDRIGIPYELVGWSEIDKYAIQAHNALYPASSMPCCPWTVWRRFSPRPRSW